MIFKKRKVFQIFFYLGLIGLSFLIIGQVFGQSPSLENTYPTIPGAQQLKTIDISFPAYLKYIYNLSIVIAGVFSFVLLAWGGLRYLFSAGKPGRMTDAKEQITASLLGLLLIFASFLIVNTINPELTQLKLLLPIAHFSAPAPPPPDSMAIGDVIMNEIPIGTLITSEFAASSFLASSSSSTDISYPSSTWPATSTGTSTRYSTDFQGALYGARLKRIHEVASTTMPIVDYIASVLSPQFMDLTSDMIDKTNELYSKAMACSCSNCTPSLCHYNDHGDCICTECQSHGDTCPDREKMKELMDSIHPYYDDDKSPIPCRAAELDYLSRALEAFEETSNLVKNEKHKDQSFYWQDEAKKLRAQIKECVDEGKIEKSQSDKIEELIDLMADTENKGTYSPKTDGPERDIGENFDELKAILKGMKRIKELINPFEKPFKDDLLAWAFPALRHENYEKNQAYSTLLTFAGATSLETTGNFKSYIKNFSIGFSAENTKVKVRDDPATFYSVGTMPAPFGSGLPLKTDKNSVFAEIVDPDPIDFDLDNPPATLGACSHLTEVPIGKTLDTAIKLTQDILREVKNIYKQTRVILNNTNEIVKKDGLAQEMYDAHDSLIKLISRIPKCPDACPAQRSGCMCSIIASDALGDIQSDIADQYNAIEKLKMKIQGLLKQSEEAKKSIYDSFYKLNSKYPDVYPDKGEIVPHPKASLSEKEKRVPIGKDYFCPDKLGNCRDDKGKLDTSKIEEREYTLKEKLAEVQRLLNMSRQLTAPKGEKSVYRILMEQFVKLKIAKKSQLNYIKSEDKYDLQNCSMMFSTTKQTRQKEPTKQLINCHEAELCSAIDPHDKEACSPDPYLDIDFFNATSSRARRPLSCYCFDGDADKSYYNSMEFPELYDNFSFLGFGNDYYCCLTNYEE